MSPPRKAFLTYAKSTRALGIIYDVTWVEAERTAFALGLAISRVATEADLAQVESQGGAVHGEPPQGGQRPEPRPAAAPASPVPAFVRAVCAKCGKTLHPNARRGICSDCRLSQPRHDLCRTEGCGRHLRGDSVGDHCKRHQPRAPVAEGEGSAPIRPDPSPGQDALIASLDRLTAEVAALRLELAASREPKEPPCS